MSFYDMLLDDLVAKSKVQLDREQIDQEITQAANAANVPKWRVVLSYGQAIAAYATFGNSMQTLIDGAGYSHEQMSELGNAIRKMAE